MLQIYAYNYLIFWTKQNMRLMCCSNKNTFASNTESLIPRPYTVIFIDKKFFRNNSVVH